MYDVTVGKSASKLETTRTSSFLSSHPFGLFFSSVPFSQLLGMLRRIESKVYECRGKAQNKLSMHLHQ
jgi:hypothetical protein